MAERLRRAYAALDMGDLDQARSLAEGILAEDPASARAHHVLGLVLVELDKPEEAMSALQRACTLYDGPWEAHLDLAVLELDHLDEPDAAASTCRSALARRPELGLKAGLLHLLGQASREMGQPAQALACHEASRLLGPDLDDPEARGLALFELGAFRKAAAALRMALKRGPGLSAEGHFHLAVILERLGDGHLAHQHFQAAARKDPGDQFVPRALSEEEFEGLVEVALGELPEEISGRLHEVPVVVEPWPDPDELRLSDPPLSPLLLGMLRGPSLRDRSEGAQPGELPTQVLLFQRNLELLCSNREEIAEEILLTVWHEVGHYLGLEEEELEERGLA